jgi:hypothetical protein
VEDIMKSTLTALLLIAFATPALAQGPSTPLREAAHRAAATEPLTQDTPAPQRSWEARHPVVLGTIAGAGAGAMFGAFTCISPIAEGNGTCDSYTDSAGARGAGAVYGAAWGAGIGALVGLAVKAVIH